MRVSDVMTGNPQFLSPQASLKVAAWLMRELDVGAIPVCVNDQLVGIITDRDIAVHAEAEGLDPTSTPVREAMTEGAAFCFSDDKVDLAANLMELKQVRRLPVLNQDQKLVGMVSLGDLAVKTKPALAGEVLERVSVPACPTR